MSPIITHSVKTNSDKPTRVDLVNGPSGSNNSAATSSESINSSQVNGHIPETTIPEPGAYGSGMEAPHTTISSLNLGPRIIGHCAECGLRITNLADACYAMGYLYHNSCFVCCCCKRTLRGKTFYKDQDKIYCDEDYLYCGFQQTAEKCNACGHIITETVLLALGNAYHPGCFRCCVCVKPLDGFPFTVDKHNQIYCIQDYHLVHGPLCALCGLVITPEEDSLEVKRVVALEKDFHIDCYRCSDCKRLLNDEPENRCYPLNEPDPNNHSHTIQRLLCLNCHLDRIGAIPATMPSVMTNKPGIAVTSHMSSTNTYYTPTIPRVQGLKGKSDQSPLVQSTLSSAPSSSHQTYMSSPLIRSSPTTSSIFVTGKQGRTHSPSLIGGTFYRSNSNSNGLSNSSTNNNNGK